MSKRPHPRARAGDESPDLLRLHAEATLHDGVVPVPFLGTTWQQRGPVYWRRRIGAAILLTILTLFVGAFAAAFTAAIMKGTGHGWLGVLLGVIYALTAVPGFLNGRRRAARAPLASRGAAPRTVMPSGCLALVFAPFSTGLALAVLVAMFGHDFMGEKRAREVTKAIHAR